MHSSGLHSSFIHSFNLHTFFILQVFKLKGADRKHKQDREKISKRPDKFSPQYECTVLADLSVDNIYIPNSRHSRIVARADNIRTPVVRVISEMNTAF